MNKEKTMEDMRRKQLLRENNFDDWLKMINFEKNDRLMEILQQTDNYIAELGDKVNIQKQMVQKVRNQGTKGQEDGSEGEENEDMDQIEEPKDS